VSDQTHIDSDDRDDYTDAERDAGEFQRPARFQPMEAASITVECGEGGFTITIDGDSVDPDYQAGRYTWRIADPEALYDHVKAAIGPWLYERDQAKAEYDRAKRAGDTRAMNDEDFSAYLDDAYGDDWSKRVGMEQMRERGIA